MAKELQCLYATGATVYFQLFDTTGQVRDVATPEWEAYSTSNIGDYDVAAAELGTASGVYAADFPASVAAGTYYAVARERAGASPAESDIAVASGTIHWTGSAAVSYSATRGLAGTALPAAAADAAGGLPVSDAGGLDLDNLHTSTRNAIRDLYSISGTVSDAGAAAGDFDGSSGLSSGDDFYNGSVLVFTSGTLDGIARKITDYTGSSRNLAFSTAFPAAPANGDSFLILGRID